jgi:putative acetyltransferase
MQQNYGEFLIRDWQEGDRHSAARVIENVLQEYGLSWQPHEADADVLAIETAYWQAGGEFWVVEKGGKIVGTAAYYPIERGEKAVEIRKMYLMPLVRRKGLGKYLLQQLEKTIAARGFKEIWLETASVLQEAVYLYEKSDYQPTSGVETARCDRVYHKRLNNSNNIGDRYSS